MTYQKLLLAQANFVVLATGFCFWQTPDEPVQVRSEVTHITEPKTQDGFIDYVAALNDQLSEGVTPDNNVVVALLEFATFEGSLNDEAYRDRFVQRLGLDELPDRSNVYVNIHQFAEAQGVDPSKQHGDPLGDRYLRAMEAPWEDKDFPLIKQWIDAGAHHMTMINAALQRPRYYHPLVTGDGDRELLMMTLLPLTQELREFARIMKTRAMNRLGNGDVEGCIDDLKTIRTLAARGRQSLTLIEHLVSVAIDGIAFSGEAHLISSGKLTRQQCEDFQRFLAELPPGNDLQQCVDRAERFMFLDIMQSVSRDGATAGDLLSTISGVGDLAQGPTAGGQHFHTLLPVLSYFVDWSESMRVGNQWYDRIVEAMNEQNDHRRLAALASIEEEIAGLEDTFTFRPLRALAFLAGPKFRGRMTGKVFLAMLLPAIEQVVVADIRAKMSREISQVAFALGAFRSDNQRYPQSIKDIIPKYLKKLPSDRYTNEPLHYAANGQGFLLYSRGWNQKDDRGHFHDSMYPGSDDVALRVNWDEQTRQDSRK